MTSSKRVRPLRSLRFRMLLPLIASACCCALVVTAAAYFLGDRLAQRQRRDRWDNVQQTLRAAAYPLTPPVLTTLSELTGTTLVTIDLSGQVLHATAPSIDALPAGAEPGHVFSAGGKRYVLEIFSMTRRGKRRDSVDRVAVLFAHEEMVARRQRAMVPPLVTGLATLGVLATVGSLIATGLIGRIDRLRRRVDLIAGGDFDSRIDPIIDDEIGQLGRAVDSMATQLARLYDEVQRRQGERLLHQVAGGMAHQLRNRLTGARMAIELHGGTCDGGDRESIDVAISQIEQSEEYVRRLTLVASGRQAEAVPMIVSQCLDQIQATLLPRVRHHNKRLDWHTGGPLDQYVVGEGITFIAAVTNLIENALQAGRRAEVSVGLSPHGPTPTLTIRVADDGPGLPAEIADDVFEPFVTSKSEGMGLGLSVARRAAQSLGGQLAHRRRHDQTVFEMTCLVHVRETATSLT